MKNVVTFETARALTEAGFPQPQPEAGQAWYIPTKTPGLIYITHVGEYYVHYAWDKDYESHALGSSKVNVESFFGAKPIFAPMAVDILREFGNGFGLTIYDSMWAVEDMYTDCPETYGKHMYSPAEACAFAYLKINKKPKP